MTIKVSLLVQLAIVFSFDEEISQYVPDSVTNVSHLPAVNTVEALVSDHLENLKKWKKLQ